MADDSSTSPRIALLFALFSAPLLAAAAPSAPVPPVRLVWARGQNADACASQSAIEREVRDRLGRDPFAAEASRSIDVVVERSDDAWSAHVVVRDDQGKTLGRRDYTTRSTDCVSIQSAAVLAIALAIDPNARLLPPAASSSASVPAPSPLPLPPPPVVSFSPPPAPVASFAPPPPALPAAPADGGSALSLRAGFAAGLVPKTSAAMELSGVQSLRGPWAATASALWVAESFASDNRFSFGLSAFSAGGCVQTPSGASWSAGGCLSGWIGSTYAVVHALLPTHPGARSFYAFSLSPFFRASIAGPLHFELAGDLFVPALRRAFTVTGWQEPAWRQPSVAGSLTGGFGLHFP